VVRLLPCCQWHKRENVVSYLSQWQQDIFWRKLQRAYERSTHERAKAALYEIKRELAVINEFAVRSLEEGLEEPLTRHRLGLLEELGRSLKTTNCIESLMALIGQRTDKVDYWRNSNQKQRWLATALMDIEPRLNRIKGYGYLLIKEGTTKRTWDKNISGGCCIMKDLGGYKISEK
jgi:putative transposase